MWMCLDFSMWTVSCDFFLRVCQEFWVCRWLVFRFFFLFFVRWDTNIHPVARGYHFDNETALNGMLNAKKLDHNDTVQERYFRVWGKKIGISVMLLTETDVFFSLPHSCCHLAETFFPNGFEIDSFNFGTRSFSLSTFLLVLCHKFSGSFCASIQLTF